MARLVVLTEGFTGLSHELKAEKVTIGRVEDNVFQIAEASVSSHHSPVGYRGVRGCGLFPDSEPMDFLQQCGPGGAGLRMAMGTCHRVTPVLPDRTAVEESPI